MTIYEIVKTVLYSLLIVILPVLINRYAKIINSKYILEKDLEARSIKYDEETILNHLNFIIAEALDEYILMNITPKNIYYISNALENEIKQSLVDTIPDRISPTLYIQLQLIYHPDYIGTMIGKRIYMQVMEYTIAYNLQQNNARPPEKNK